MSNPRFALPLSTLVLLVACNQVNSALSRGGEEKAADSNTEVVDAKAPPAPAVAAPPAPTGPASVDELLGLVHDGAASYVIFKAPDALLSLAETTASTFEQPLTTLVGATSPTDLSRLTESFALFKHGVADAKEALAKSGTDLARGIVVTSTSLSDDDTVITFSASSGEAAKGLLAALKIPDAATIECQPTAARPGYVTCAKDQATLATYKPGDGKAARTRLGAALPAVALDDLALFGYVTDGDVHFGLDKPAGGATFHLSAPPDARELVTTLAPGPADLLKFAPAGTGFMWMKLDLDELKKKGMNDIPPPFSATVSAFTGEVLFGGSADPAALQARFGFSDTSTLAPLADLAVAFGGPAIHNKPIPDVPGSKVSFKAENVEVGAVKVKALHFGASGVPQAKTLADQLGLSLDAWVFPAEGTLAAVVGADASKVGLIKAAASSDATIAALPPALAASLRAGEVGFVGHVPLDGLQSPALLKLLDSALATVPGYSSANARSALGVVASLSSTTVWISEHANTGVIHFALQSIGNTTDDEGKEALAAAASADPVKAFADLATKYPSSPRLAAYQTRAGQGGAGALVGGSAPALLLAAGGMAAFFRSSVDAPPPPVVVEAPVAEPPKPEKTEPAKTETPKTETPKTETPKTETPKTETPKTETPKTETPKTETPKTETPKTETPKTGGIKIDTTKVEPRVPPKRVGIEK
ncbi:hypothetical protein [Nannocystis bainbridge]|uniref:Uncharacterized protein n=1 Tax=Nannocystis bainbridge TaxID=2995303 RepID=A0ABT5DRQ0_9BACT|nr:hypothetical protein [Nannocystis bainbridge]MDC0716269.1 hypothetical protein [Nannocystis bainbridge]